jgi:predicted ATPase
MRTYLQQFFPCLENRHVYPYRVVFPMMLEHIDFAPITILYCNNGSGKSTLLNVMARHLGLKKMTLGNDNEYFEGYVKKCSSCIDDEGLPEESSFIRSEDIMVKIAKQRKLYAEIKNEVFSDKEIEKMSDYGISENLYEKALTDPESVNAADYALLSRLGDFQKARLKLDNSEATSNGETALEYFKEHLFDESFYLLDEPENSMAPAFQQQLAQHIELLARLDTQFVIATHSPFLLAIPNARIYDLDARPSMERAWYELENMKAYYRLFKQFEDRF